MIYRVTGDRAESGSVNRECAVRATTRVPETALVPEMRRSDYGRQKNSAHNGDDYGRSIVVGVPNRIFFDFGKK